MKEALPLRLGPVRQPLVGPSMASPTKSRDAVASEAYVPEPWNWMSLNAPRSSLEMMVRRYWRCVHRAADAVQKARDNAHTRGSAG